MLHACMRKTRTRGFVRGKNSDAVWPGLEAYRRWSTGRHFSIFSRSCQLLTWCMIASWSSLSSSLFCQFYPSAGAGVAYPDWGQRLVDVLVRAKFFFVMFVSGRLVNPVTSACASWMVFRDRLALCSCEGLRDWDRRSASEQAECESLADPESIFDWKEGAAALRFAGCWGWMMLRRAFRLSGGTRSWIRRPTWR